MSDLLPKPQRRRWYLNSWGQEALLTSVLGSCLCCATAELQVFCSEHEEPL